LLKDVVSFIQTIIIKLYVEKGDKKAIYNFFSTSHNKKSIYIDQVEIQEFLSRIQDQSICAVTMALILENTGEYSKALEKWQQLKTEEGCYKTVQILRKSQIIDDKVVFKYLEWVLVKMPDIGLSLFLDRNAMNFKSSDGGSLKSGGQDEKS
jgi:hypothetical protein